MPPLPITPLDLLGPWRLDRSVHDRLTGETHRVTGTMTLALDSPGHVAWSEAGMMRSADRSVPVSRRLDIIQDDDHTWNVHFADGRFFHRWAPGDTVIHDCTPDRYTGTIIATSAADGTVPAWSVIWEASGPAKNYQITSDLVPVPETDLTSRAPSRPQAD